MTHDDHALICIAEVATLLGIAPRTLAAWRQRSFGPAPLRLTSRTLRYRRADVLAWVERLRGGGRTETAA